MKNIPYTYADGTFSTAQLIAIMLKGVPAGTAETFRRLSKQIGKLEDIGPEIEVISLTKKEWKEIRSWLCDPAVPGNPATMTILANHPHVVPILDAIDAEIEGETENASE